MSFKYSICHPDKPNIEYPKNTLNASAVKEMVHSYPWKEALKKMHALPKDAVYYSPSLDFTNLNNNYTFCLSAVGEDLENFTFYIFYNRKIKKKILFGLLGEKEDFYWIDKSFSREAGHSLLDHFLSGNYQQMEKLMQ
ncbi:MAG: hypothetical protein KBT69_10470 [Oceanihabitans sp.]|nr:hypothetical protein [Oceanihabitans sp.]